MVPGEGEEDVIEVGGVHGELLGVDGVLGEVIKQGLQRLHAAVGQATRNVRFSSSLVAPASSRAAASSSRVLANLS